MQDLINELNNLDLVIKNSPKEKDYEILPVDLNSNCSISQIETILTNLNGLMKYVQLASNAKGREKPANINSDDPKYVCLF